MLRKRRWVIGLPVLLTFTISLLVPILPVASTRVQAGTFSINCYTGVKIMPVGDSITKGSHSTGTVGYRKPLYEVLASKFGANNIDFVGSTSNGSFPQPEHNGYSGFFAVDPSSNTNSIDDYMNTWLNLTPPDFVLLHVGTNDIDILGGYSANEIAAILNMIDDYSPNVYVILALIINRMTFSSATASFNDNVEAMANARIANGDLIKIVDMEDGAGLNYSLDMDDDKHPNDSGYGKMAIAWFTAIDGLCSGSPIVINPGTQGSEEGETIPPLQIEASDPTGQALLFSQTGLPSNLAINPSTGVISGTVSYDAYTGAPYNVTVIVTDADNNTSSVDFSWTITNTNQAPVIESPGNQSSPEGGSITPLQIDAQDPDGDGLTFDDNGTLPAGLSINPVSGWISGDLGYDVAGSYPVMISVTDIYPSNPLSESVSFTWTVANTNRLPEFYVLPGDQSDSEGDTVSLQIQASDPDPDDSLVFSASGLPEGLAIDPSSGLISGILTYDASIGSPHPVSVTASDGTGQATANFTWQVSDRNGPPQLANPGDQTDAEMHPVHLELQVNDPDLNDSLSFSLGAGSFLPAGIYLNPDTGLIAGQIASGAASDSPYTVAVIVKDNGLPQLSAQVTFDWNVVPFNYPPDNSTLFLPLVIH